MITYRLAEPEDVSKIEEFCNLYEVAFPLGTILLAEDENEDIVGLAGLEMRAHLEPLIGKNKFINYKLWKAVEEFCKRQSIPYLYCIKDKSETDLHEHAGFEVIETTKAILRKLLKV